MSKLRGQGLPPAPEVGRELLQGSGLAVEPELGSLQSESFKLPEGEKSVVATHIPMDIWGGSRAP